MPQVFYVLRTRADGMPLVASTLEEARQEHEAAGSALQAMHDLLIRAFCSGATDLYLCGDKGSLHAIGLDECQPPWG